MPARNTAETHSWFGAKLGLKLAHQRAWLTQAAAHPGVNSTRVVATLLSAGNQICTALNVISPRKIGAQIMKAQGAGSRRDMGRSWPRVSSLPGNLDAQKSRSMAAHTTSLARRSESPFANLATATTAVTPAAANNTAKPVPTPILEQQTWLDDCQNVTS